MSNYDDIIDRQYHGSTSIKKMPIYARAAQFAPFAALTGHNAAIKETARLTSKFIELSPDEQLKLSQKLNLVLAHIDEHPELSISFFLRDSQKTGGSYVTLKGHITKYSDFDRIIILSDDTIIKIKDIISIEGVFFETNNY